MKEPMHAAENAELAARKLAVCDLQSELAGPFDLAAEAGQPVVVTGESGSGKSLFLRMVADLDPNEGTVSLHGRDRRTFPACKWRKMVTYVAAESGWWLDTISDHFSAGHSNEAAAIAGELGLASEQWSAPVSRLSSGERQRWALVRAVVHEPTALLLDEPTGALDQLSVERVERFLRRLLERGTTIILVTHDPGLAERMGGRHFRMVDRKLCPA